MQKGLRITWIYPHIKNGGYSYFTGVNVYHNEAVIGVCVGLLGLGFSVEYL